MGSLLNPGSLLDSFDYFLSFILTVACYNVCMSHLATIFNLIYAIMLIDVSSEGSEGHL